METRSPGDSPQTPPLDVASRRASALEEQGRVKEALDIHLQIASARPENADAWGNAAVLSNRLHRWQDAIRYAHAALARGCDRFELYDALSRSCGALKQEDAARRYGLRALDMRARQFSGPPVIPPPTPQLMPPPPSAQTRDRNVIAFSLFGGNSKYCESAVLNVQEQPRIYPHWVCRFYVDASVPESVISRLRKDGAQIVPIDGSAAHWPGPMWRLLALDDPLAHRILFRDADSVISRREAAAVDQWLISGKRFHMMRDACSHTELILAGLWGTVGGSLPPLQELMQQFMSEPIKSRHFADQFFLRQYVWPYARTSLMQHDSMFGFMNAVPFPDREKPAYFHVGCTESAPFFSVKSNQPDGSEVTWALYLMGKRDDGQTHEELVCAYPGIVKNGAVTAHIPNRYAQRLEQGTARVRLTGRDAAVVANPMPPSPA